MRLIDRELVETASYFLSVGEQFRRARFDRRLMSSIENELKIKFVLFKYCFVVRGLVICKQYHSDRILSIFIQARSMY